VKSLLDHLFFVLAHLGGFGLLLLGVLDSSFLVLPFGNDLVVLAMIARRHALMPYYVCMAVIGSVLGCIPVDLISRKGGEKGLERHVPRRRLEYVRHRINKNAAWALAFASLMPPPFPFTPFLMSAASWKYPRKKLLAVVGVARLVRFSIEGLLAILVGEKILQLARSRMVEYAVVALVIVSLIASAVSVYGWIKQSRGANRKPHPREE